MQARAIYLGRSLILCVLLHCFCTALTVDLHTPQASGPDVEQSLLQLLRQQLNVRSFTVTHTTDTLTVVKRQDEQQTNTTTATVTCTPSQTNRVILNLDDSCVDALADLNVASPLYSASDKAVSDIAIVCRENCAGELIYFDELCPGYYQNIKTYLQGICSLNSEMERCALSVADNDGSRVYRECFEETNAFERCRTRCQNALVDFSTDIGCCVNTFYNDTWNFFGNLRLFHPNLNHTVDPSLWLTCRVPYPNECPNELFPSPSPTSAPTTAAPITTSTPTPLTPHTPSPCSHTIREGSLQDSCVPLLNEFQSPLGLLNIAQNETKMAKLCSLECGGEYAKQCSERTDRDFLLEHICGQFSHKSCGFLLTQNYLSNLIRNLSSSCGPVSRSVPCSTECQSALETAVSMLGCCMFPHTLEVVSERVGIAASVDGRLWSLCGLEQPLKCPDPFITATNEPQRGSSSKVWLAGVLVPLVLLLSVVIALAATVAISVKNRHKHGVKRSSEGANGDDMVFNQSYSRVSIPAGQQGNTYAAVVIKPRGFFASSQSLLEVLDSSPHVTTHHTHYDRVFGAPRTREDGRESCEGGEGVRGEGVRCEGVRCEGVRCEGVGCEGVTVRAGEEEDERGFEYTTTANIARHLRSETNRGAVNDESHGYANICPSISAVAESAGKYQPAESASVNNTVIYQEPRLPTQHHSISDGGATCMSGELPVPSPQYHYVQPESHPLYHCPRTGVNHRHNTWNTTLVNKTTNDGYIETETNISYTAQATPTTPPTDSGYSGLQLHTSLPLPSNHHYQKPVVKPRKNTAGQANTHTKTAVISRDGERVTMATNISYGVSSKTYTSSLQPVNHNTHTTTDSTTEPPSRR